MAVDNELQHWNVAMMGARSDRLTVVVFAIYVVVTTELLSTVTVVNGQDGNTECKWSLSGDEQNLYRRTSPIDWGDTAWEVVSPEICWGGGWTCYIASERFWKDGRWKNLTSLATYKRSSDVFRISYQDVTSRNRCRRRRFVEWKVNTTDTTLTGLVIQLNVICDLTFNGGDFTHKDCLILRPKGEEPNTANVTRDENSTIETECGWTFVDESQTMYRRTSQLHWGDTDWPATNVSKRQISPNFCDAWACSVQEQRFWSNGQWRGLSFLGQEGISDNIFHLFFKDENDGNCSRHWFVQWHYTEYIAQLRPVLFQLGITCSSTGKHTERECITFETGENLKVTTPSTTSSTLRSRTSPVASTTSTHATSMLISSPSTTKRRSTLGSTTTTTSISTRLSTLSSTSLTATRSTLGASASTTTASTTRMSIKASSTSTARPLSRPTTVHITTDRVIYCQEQPFNVGDRELIWPQTMQGMAFYHHCPNGTVGQIQLICGDGGTWQGEPDLFNCTTHWIQKLQISLALRVDPEDVLLEMTNGLVAEKPVDTFDIIKIIDMIGVILERQEDEMQFSNMTQGGQGDMEEQRESLLAFAQRIIKSSSALLKSALDVDWMDIPQDRRTQAAAALLERVEKLGILLVSLLPNDTISIIDENIVFAVGVIFMEDPTFPDSTKLLNTSWSGVRDSISLPQTDHHAVATLYNTIHKYLTSSSSKGIVNSRVISTTLVNGTISDGERVTIFLKHSKKHLKDVLNKTLNFTSSCGYWNFPLKDWSADSCEATESNMTHTTCECTHLTNFAILARVVGDHDEFALHVITWVGCGISIVCFIICICVFLGSKRVRCPRTIVHANLCICLLLAEIIFLAAVDKTQNKGACEVVAIVLHYLFLAAFAWMCVEGMELYALLVQIFNLQNKRVYYYHLIGYGVPAVVVIISVGVNYLHLKVQGSNGYGTDRYCWLSVENNFIWSFVGPMIFMILVNLGFLVMTLRLVYTQRANRELTHTNTDKSEKEGRGKKFRFWIRVSVTLICLLGLTWLLGVLYISNETVVFAYFFTIANSFQGLFIFIFHCLKNEKVQIEIQRCCFPKRSKLQRRRPTGTTFRELLGSFSSRSNARRGTETTSIGNVGSPLRRDGRSFIRPASKSISRTDWNSSTTDRTITMKSNGSYQQGQDQELSSSTSMVFNFEGSQKGPPKFAVNGDNKVLQESNFV
ncbi:adhesion G protein-coupled receptor L2-like isoform X2 [Branchiostoma lanceolatum]|uniref:adhesion G protein-coupled receptor L2-like isoform X2 n=1 Tax=Branchiostoma lanceolatum TaxID=7740 RepID=UPI0034549ACA